MERIVVSQRSNDWHACWEGDPGTWACGRTVEAAIAHLTGNGQRVIAAILNPPGMVDGVPAPWE